MRIQVSDETVKLLKKSGNYQLELRGDIKIKVSHIFFDKKLRIRATTESLLNLSNWGHFYIVLDSYRRASSRMTSIG